MGKKISDLQKWELTIVLGIVLVLHGGFFDYAVAVSGVCITVLLFIRLLCGRRFYKRDSRKIFLVPLLFLVLAFFVSFWAIDASENLFGVLRLSVLYLWMWLLRCSEKEARERAVSSIPVWGSVMVLVCVCAWFVPSIKNGFWENDRLAGFFQYANTSALFLAVGMMLLISEAKKTCKKKAALLIQGVILMAGMLLTGSRSVLLLFLLWAVYFALKNKAFQKPFALAAVTLGCLGAVFVLVTKNTQNIGRIFTLFSSNSTFWGRLLYDRDALVLLTQKWYGLGRMGYYYSQGTFQSGVYHVRYVHNDFLQTALDYGIAALVLLCVFLGWQFVCGRQERRAKEILFFLCTAALADFHFQYLVMLFVAALFLDYGAGKQARKKELAENYIILPLLFAVLGYLGIAAGCAKLGNYDIALSMLPDYTYAQEKQMQRMTGTEQAYVLAQQLLQKNPYNSKAYAVRGSFYASGFWIEECMADFDRFIELAPYQTEYYKQYDELLQMFEEQLMSAEDTEALRALSEKMENRRRELPVQLKKMQERTSALAYKIKDVPQFSY